MRRISARIWQAVRKARASVMMVVGLIKQSFDCVSRDASDATRAFSMFFPYARI